MDDAYDPVLRAHIRRAFARLRRRLREEAPILGRHVGGWMRSLSAGAPPETYFTSQAAFPMLVLPWWLETEIAGAPDPAFQGDVVYSTISGYYFVRMVDDIMDRERPPDAAVVPALIVLHTEFQLAYQRHFVSDDPFWEAFAGLSFGAAEMASVDAALTRIDRTTFMRVSARKTAGAKVPIAAVCHRYRRPELLEPWSAFIDLLGCWHQMLNDIRGWHRDLEAGRATYFLSEADARRGSAGSVSDWIVTEGLEWGFSTLDGWMDEMLAAGGRLGCRPLVAYLEERGRSLQAERDALRPALAALERLSAAMR